MIDYHTSLRDQRRARRRYMLAEAFSFLAVVLLVIAGVYYAVYRATL